MATCILDWRVRVLRLSSCVGFFLKVRKAPLRGFLSKTRTKKMDFDFCRTTGPCLASATADMNGGELKLTDMVRRCLDVM